MRVDAALADEPELRQPLEQGRGYLRALADEHERLGLADAPRQRFGFLEVVVPHRHGVARELAEAGQGAQRVEVVVEDRDLHGLGIIGARTSCPVRRAWPA